MSGGTGFHDRAAESGLSRSESNDSPGARLIDALTPGPDVERADARCKPLLEEWFPTWSCPIRFTLELFGAAVIIPPPLSPLTH